ncbi:related to gibberellin 20-oxidase [Rhynchosporium secalis]|uniref:Related to gibberellin 20-oxidase n=1 Tax=Rhynchosporium secalis TaxID=38038 RepID=A0A1E1MIS6_RHYSE|nr:related to gibberellin 20-oxidase [Rhynchosporium secalis]
MSVTTTHTETQQSTLVSKDSSKYSYANLSPYVHPPETSESLPWAELVTLDLSDYTTPGGKQRLASQLSHAVHNVGFFYVKNFGLTQQQIDKQFTLAKNFFSLPISEKEKYEIDYGNADYNGWRRSGRGNISNAKDNYEIFNIPKFTDDFKGKYSLPDLLKEHIDEIEVFSKALHSNVVIPLLRLFAIILELPDEEYLVKQHTYAEKSEDHFRYMIYHTRTPEEHEASGYGQSAGHTDLGTVTLLFRQPVAGLQILGDDGKWTYVSAQPGTITVNLADTISHLTGGWLKSSVHRVVAPPRDQWPYDRTGLLYFARPHNDTVLNPILNSPVLEREGVKPRFQKPVTMEEWVKAKQTLQLNPEIARKKYAESGDGTVELIGGFRDRQYK